MSKFFHNRKLLVLLVGVVALLPSCNSHDLVPLEGMMRPKPIKNITITIKEYCPREGNRHLDFFATARSYVVQNERMQTDWDRDGIPNHLDYDSYLNIHYRKKDTNDDGFGDLLIYRARISSVEQQRLRCRHPECLNGDVPDTGKDADGDGLTCCEEKLLGTSDTDPDHDGDGIPDGLEVRNGLNPIDRIDATLDSDGDGSLNVEEVKANTPLLEGNNAQMELFALHYESVNLFPEQPECFEYTVSNLPVVNVDNGNLYQFAFVEEDPVHDIAYVITKNIVVPRTVEGGVELEFYYDEIE